MNKEEQRFAIAEFCGYKPDPETNLWYGIGEDVITGFNTHKQRIEPLPDYLNDLNAMYEAIESLNENQRAIYASWHYLGRPCSFQTDSTNTSIFKVCHTKPSKQAEDFLKTLNLWKES